MTTITLTLSALSLQAGITRTSISNLYGFRTFENAESSASTGSLWIPTASEVVEDSRTNFDSYLANTTFHYSNWGQSSASVSIESRKLATNDRNTEFRTSINSFVRITVSDDLFFTRPNDPENTDLIPITLKFEISSSNGNTGFPERPGFFDVGPENASPGYINLLNLASENEGENIEDGSFGTKAFSWDFVRFPARSSILEVDFGFGQNEAQLLVEPGREITLAHKLQVEQTVSYILNDPQMGDSLNVGGGGRASLRVWIEVADDIHLETDSGYDYRLEPTLIESADQLWGGYEIVGGEWVETEFFGWINISFEPWIYSFTKNVWFYMPEEALLNQTGLWIYLIR